MVASMWRILYIIFSWWYVVPKSTIKFYGDGALKMYRLVAHFSLYIRVEPKMCNKTAHF